LPKKSSGRFLQRISGGERSGEVKQRGRALFPQTFDKLLRF
jgi:hypothetical protein